MLCLRRGDYEYQSMKIKGRLKARLGPLDLYEGIVKPLRRVDKINATYRPDNISRDLE